MEVKYFLIGHTCVFIHTNNGTTEGSWLTMSTREDDEGMGVLGQGYTSASGDEQIEPFPTFILH